MHEQEVPAGKSDETALIYDAECPVCAAYGGAVETDVVKSGSLRRIDARSDHQLVRRATEQGLDLVQGMVVVHQGRLFHGADALHLMARLAPARGLRNKVNRLLFGSQSVSRVAYPVLRGGRNTLLRILGKTKINNLE